MAKDPKVASAISHWAPRFVSNGVLLADFEEVTASLERWEDWCEAWSRRAEVHGRLGRDAFKDGHKLTASEHFIRAAIYYHFAKFVFVNDPKQMHAAHQSSQRSSEAVTSSKSASSTPFETKRGAQCEIAD